VRFFLESAGVFGYGRRALALVWSTHRGLSVGLGLSSVAAGLLPAAIAYVGKLIIDALVAGGAEAEQRALTLVAAEMALVLVLGLSQRGNTIARSLLRAELGQRVNQLILEKALSLSLVHFEDSELYDKLTRARREASSRPLSLVTRTFGIVQDLLSLVSYAALLLSFSSLAVLVLVVAALPAFLAETRYSGEAFRLARRRTPESREQSYLESVIAREDHAKEVKLFGLGQRLLDRYTGIFRALYLEDRSLTLRRGLYGYLCGLLSTAAFYATYAAMALSALRRSISLGDMTMYLMVFKQGQSAMASLLSAIGGMYEDNLYLSNLYELLDFEVPLERGTLVRGAEPGDGIRFLGVSFAYPGSSELALAEIDLHIAPGEKLAVVGENGSGKTTLIKLLTRLYEPSKGRITLDGSDLQAWDPQHLRERIGVIFQDFARYQFTVGENVGVGDVHAIEQRPRIVEASEKGLARGFIERLPEGYETQLGRWFKDGRELSLGQWQKIALSRAFMRKNADILVLDEPTASIDAEAEMQIFERFRELTHSQIALIISHRFSTVRIADTIVVLERGRILERGSHEQLVALAGRYAHWFGLQASGYR
jgi:ABC-type multidrug transport system fused ATPase/permease subunit